MPDARNSLEVVEVFCVVFCCRSSSLSLFLPDQKNEVDDESPLKKPIQMQCFVSEHFLVFFLDDGMYYGSILF